MKILALLSISSLLPVLAQANTPLNDISHSTSKKFDINVMTQASRTDDGSTTTAAIFTVEHSHTNTLRCEISVSVPIISETGAERIIRVTMPDELIFPKAAFPDKNLSYDIDLSGILEDGETIKVNYRRKQVGAAVCRGLGPNYRLPNNTCVELSLNHDNFCRENSNYSGAKYGLIRYDQYLGICSCD